MVATLENTLRQRMSTYLSALDGELRAILHADTPTDDLFWGMMQYQMGWVDADLNAVDVSRGKQIRPILNLLCCEAADGDWHNALPAAAAIEILHNFSLVHDDIEDNSPLRRGRPTVWKVWGEPQAINTGDAMFAAAQYALTRLVERGVSAETTVTIFRRFNETCLALTKGQFSDMAFETRTSVSVDEYLAMIEGKTAVLIALAAELGARIAGHDEATVAHYAEFGRNLGLAFQVQDDILGIWGDEAVIGKSAESDILTKKKSVPVLYGLANSTALRNHYQADAETPNFVETAINLLNEVEAKTYAASVADRFSKNALQSLDAANPTGQAAQALRQLTHELLTRKA